MCIKDIMLRELRDFGDAKGNLTVHRIPYEMTSAPVSGDRNSRIVVNPVFLRYLGIKRWHYTS